MKVINKELRDHLNEDYENLVMFENPSFDNSIIGVTSDLSTLIYDYNLMVKEFAEENECSEEDAEDFIQYNTIRAIGYYGDAPIVVMPL